MKTKISKLLLTLCLGGVLTGLTSCLSSDGENTYVYTDYCTITGSVGAGYLLYSDSGDRIVPTTSSVVNYYGETGFGSYKRALVQFTYTQQNILTSLSGNRTFSNVTMTNAQRLSLKETLTLAEAETKGITSTDSTWNVIPNAVWMNNGYVDIAWSGYYSTKGDTKIAPTLNMAYDESKIGQNVICFTFYYNRHDSKPTNDQTYVQSIECFNVKDLDELVPGSDSINVTFQAQTGDSIISQTSRLPREAFRRDF